jgi:hypothetical protein
MTQKLKPFDLAIALDQPHRVVTRDFRRIKDLTLFDIPDSDKNYSLAGIMDGELDTWYSNGNYYSNDQVLESENDLLLLPEKKTFWINIYSNSLGGYEGGLLHKSESDAQTTIVNRQNCIATKQIDIEI